MLQRVVEFLPIEQLYKEESHTVKAVSRAWRTAARRALTRGRWKPLLTLEDRCEITLETGSWTLETETRHAFDRDAREAWTLYSGDVLLLLLHCHTLAMFDYLSLVVEPSKQGFGSIVAAFEKMLQLERRHTDPGAVLYLLVDWSRQAMPGSLPNGTIYFDAGARRKTCDAGVAGRRARALGGPGLGGKSRRCTD